MPEAKNIRNPVTDPFELNFEDSRGINWSVRFEFLKEDNRRPDIIIQNFWKVTIESTAIWGGWEENGFSISFVVGQEVGLHPNLDTIIKLLRDQVTHVCDGLLEEKFVNRDKYSQALKDYAKWLDERDELDSLEESQDE